MQIVGATGLGGLYAIEWHIRVTNLRCVQGYEILILDSHSLSLIVSEKHKTMLFNNKPRVTSKNFHLNFYLWKSRNPIQLFMLSVTCSSLVQSDISCGIHKVIHKWNFFFGTEGMGWLLLYVYKKAAGSRTLSFWLWYRILREPGASSRANTKKSCARNSHIVSLMSLAWHSDESNSKNLHGKF